MKDIIIMNLFMLDILKLTPPNEELLKIEKSLDWDSIESLLIYSKNRNKNTTKGRKGYGVLTLFRCILLQTLYNYTDRMFEKRLPQSIDYVLFTGLDIGLKTPDRSTIRNFRKFLMKNKLYDKLFEIVNMQLEKLQIIPKKSKIGIIDATVVESYYRPRSKIVEQIPEDRKENELSIYDTRISYSKDVDAKWLFKRGKYHYGYKLFLTVNENGYILKYKATPANEGECPHFSDMISGINVEEIQADKAYYSRKNIELLKANNIKNGLIRKAHRNHALSKEDLDFNKKISKTRFIVERTNGQLKRRFNFTKTMFNGIEKFLYEATLKSICSNILLSLKHIIL